VRALPLLVLLALTSGCYAPPSAPAPQAGEFHLELLGATPGASAMRWSVALANGNADALHGVKVTISVKYYRTKDAGQDERVVDVPGNETSVVTLNTTYMGFGDYDYTIQALDAQGHVLDGEQDLFELCYC
jgi:hypothetical protein